MLRLATFSAAVLAGFLSIRAADANLIVNPGFETGDLSGWTVSGGFPNIGVDSYAGDVHGGGYGVFAGNGVQTGLSQTVATVIGATYAVSFWLDVYQADATTGFADARFGGQTVAALSEPAETDVFTEYTASLVATSTSSTLAFTFLDPPGFFGFDDVSVTETSGPVTLPVPEPAALELFAAGLAGLALIRRERRRQTEAG